MARVGRRAGWVLVAALAVALLGLGGCGDDGAADTGAPRATAGQLPSRSTDTAPATTAGERFSDLPVVEVADLPVEAIDTLELIASGGPYPYRQDDSVFENREGILPDQPIDYYREYTVDTPGSGDRGARRIVAGSAGDRYYTDDHYDSFREIAAP